MVKLLGGREEEASLDPFTIHPKINVRKKKKFFYESSSDFNHLRSTWAQNLEQYIGKAGLQQGNTLLKIFHFRFKTFALLLTQRSYIIFYDIVVKIY
jgi:hypothetical protein